MAVRLPCMLACLMGFAFAAPAAARIEKASWGALPDGRQAELYTLTNAKGAVARITNYGARLVDLLMPDRDGRLADMVLGFDDLASYLKGGVQGAVIGRYANRIGSNGSFPLEGRIVELDRRSGQTVVIHGGTAGFQNQLWQMAAMRGGAEPSLTLALVSPDGAGGFPGTLVVMVTYTLTSDNILRLDYRARTDKPTIVNLTNHAYFNIGGEGSGDVSNEILQVFADFYTPADSETLPTGEIAPVAGTPLDFRKPVRLGDVLGSDFPQIAMRKGLDVNMIVRGTPGTLRPAARISDPKSGRVMEVFTTQPGLQLYSNNIARPTIGKGGKSYGNHSSMSFETQHYPDSPNHPDFPSTEIVPGKPLHEITEFRFSIE